MSMVTDVLSMSVVTDTQSMPMVTDTQLDVYGNQHTVYGDWYIVYDYAYSLTVHLYVYWNLERAELRIDTHTFDDILSTSHYSTIRETQSDITNSAGHTTNTSTKLIIAIIYLFIVRFDFSSIHYIFSLALHTT